MNSVFNLPSWQVNYLREFKFSANSQQVSLLTTKGYKYYGMWRCLGLRALSTQLQIPKISVGISNGTDHFGLVRPEYSGPALKVVHCDRSGHFGRSDRNVPFHLTKLLSPVPLFCILLTRTITKRAVDWVGSVQPECTVPLGTWNFRNFKPQYLLNGKRRKT